MIENTEYKVGDIVRIRSWDDMFDEFGKSSYGGIAVPDEFGDHMRFLCGRKYVIQTVIEDPSKDYINFYLKDLEKYEDHEDYNRVKQYVFNKHMVESYVLRPADPENNGYHVGPVYFNSKKNLGEVI